MCHPSRVEWAKQGWQQIVCGRMVAAVEDRAGMVVIAGMAAVIRAGMAVIKHTPRAVVVVEEAAMAMETGDKADSRRQVVGGGGTHLRLPM